MIIIIDPDGRKLGDKYMCAQIAGIHANAFATYQRDKRPKNNPVPQPVRRDMETGAYLTDLEEVRAWAARRPRFRAKETTP